MSFQSDREYRIASGWVTPDRLQLLVGQHGSDSGVMRPFGNSPSSRFRIDAAAAVEICCGKDRSDNNLVSTRHFPQREWASRLNDFLHRGIVPAEMLQCLLNRLGIK